MLTARGFLYVASYKNKLLAIGGCGINGEHLSVETYDPEADSWTDAEIPLKSTYGMINGCTYSSKCFYQNLRK